MSASRPAVIDGDGHIIESYEGIYDFLEGVKGPIGNTLVSPFPWLDGRHTLVDPIRWQATDAARWREFMDYAGIAQAVLYPTAALSLGTIQVTDYAVKVARAYNRWLYASHLEPEPRLHAPALLPSQDVAAAVEELRTCVQQYGMSGGMLCSVTWDMTPYGDPKFDPIFAEAERLDVPIVLHGGSTTGLNLDMLRQFAAAHALEHPLPLFIHLASMLFGGLFERHPNLRVGLFEAGSTWVPFMMDRLDYDFKEVGKTDPIISTLKRLPSEVISGGNIFVTCEPGERFLPMALDAIGPSRVMYASDFPHELEFEEYPEGIKELAGRTDLSDSARADILGEAALAFYGLPVTAPETAAAKA